MTNTLHNVRLTYLDKNNEKLQESTNNYIFELGCQRKTYTDYLTVNRIDNYTFFFFVNLRHVRGPEVHRLPKLQQNVKPDIFA